MAARVPPARARLLHERPRSLPIREACGKEFVILTPGIRPKGSEVGDQQRVMTPEDAVRAGADYIVVGRPITSAADPRSAAQRVVEEMARA